MSEFILPESAEIVDPISDSECISLGNNTGLNINDGESTCQALTTRLMPLLAQIVGDISSGTKTIYANDDSKCSADDKSPTLASMMSRIYRVSQAFTCILCEYDPTLSNMLLSGSYPQVLMGKQAGQPYPSWVTPDALPEEGSGNVVTSNGVYQAIRNAILSVWHLWEKGDNGTFQYFVTSSSALPSSGNTEGDFAIVFNTTNNTNTIYKWHNNAWVSQETIQPGNMEDFAVIHIVKGDMADRGLYWFEDGWNVLDADIGEIESRIVALETKLARSIGQVDTTTKYKLGVVNNYSAASSVPAEAGVTKIIFIARS